MKTKKPDNQLKFSSLNVCKLIDQVSCLSCSGRNLIFLPERESLFCQDCNSIYPVVKQVPVMLPSKIKESQGESEIHKIYGTPFSYIEHYQKDAIEFDYFQSREGATAHSERRIREYISSEIRTGSGKILDLGCGSAWVAGIFCMKGYEVTSLDISEINVIKALDLYPFENHLGIVADAFHLPYPDNSFDFIVASEVLEHVKEPADFISNLFKILKPGGTLLVTTPYREKINYSLCVHCNRMTPHNAHLHSFDDKILAALLFCEDLRSFNISAFGNKVLIHLRTHVLLKYSGFRTWKMIDRIADLIYRAPSTYLAEWKKK